MRFSYGLMLIKRLILVSSTFQLLYFAEQVVVIFIASLVTIATV